MTITEQTILNALKHACLRAGNQFKLAQRTGLSQGQLSDYICGRRKIRNMTLRTFFKLFPELTISFFQNQPPEVSDSVEHEIIRIIRQMTGEEKAKCLKILAVIFSDKFILPETLQKKF